MSRIKGKKILTNISQVISGNQIEKNLKLAIQYHFIKKKYSVFLEKNIATQMTLPDLCKVDGNLAGLEFEETTNRYRADVLAINTKSEIVIIEIKSSKRDYTSDNKFLNYRHYCDKLYLAVTDDWLSDEMIADIPKEVGIIHVSLDSKNHPVFQYLRKARKHKMLKSGTRYAMMVNLAWHSGLSVKQVMLRKPVIK